MAADEPTKAWSSIVPEFYYDLISRIPPGVLLTLLVAYEFGVLSEDNIDRIFRANAGLVTALSVFLLGIGYSVGLCLSVPGSKFRGSFFSRAIKHLRPFQKEWLEKASRIPPFKLLNLDGKTDWTQTDYRNMLWLVHYHLKLQSVDAKVMLPKMTAEVMLFCNTAISVLVWLAVHSMHSVCLRTWPRPSVFITSTAVAIIMVITGRRAAQGLIDRRCYYLGVFLGKSLKPEHLGDGLETSVDRGER